MRQLMMPCEISIVTMRIPQIKGQESKRKHVQHLFVRSIEIQQDRITVTRQSPWGFQGHYNYKPCIYAMSKQLSPWCKRSWCSHAPVQQEGNFCVGMWIHDVEKNTDNTYTHMPWMHEANKNIANKSRIAHRHEPEWHIRRNHMAKKMRENAYAQWKIRRMSKTRLFELGGPSCHLFF